MSGKVFGENSDVHLMSSLNSEYTMCGDAFDCDSEPGGEYIYPTKKQVVTCERCIQEIENCRNVKTN